MVTAAANRKNHEAHEEQEGEKIFFRFYALSLADLRVLGDLRGERKCKDS
jgi:hypothetical protein